MLKPVSLLALSVQARSISEVECVVAVRLVGAAGGPPAGGGPSLSRIDRVAFGWSRVAPPVGLESVRRMVSVGSWIGSLAIVTLKVLPSLSPSGQLRVPRAG